MTIRQHYYTSCRTETKTGFQTKAATPEIPRQAEETLLRLISYRPPANAAPQAIETHPVSLRFFTPGPGEALLICVQSNGPDEFFRPGNFFAHSLIGPLNAFMEPLAPIFYWGSPFWVRQDDSAETVLPALNALVDSARSTFDYDAIWPFLTPRRREWLYRLLCAVLDYPASKRRIVIADSAEHTALWIAALTMALPYQHRALLTFATYHHDPYNVPFLVTGTTPDSSFRFSTDDYHAYFVLHETEGRISSAPESEFAQFVCDRFTANQYESELLDFFMLLKRRAPGATPDPAQLATLTRFHQLQSGGGLLTSAAVRESTHAVITEITGSRKLEATDIHDLRAAWTLLADDLLETQDIAPLPDFLAALERLSRIDPEFEDTCGLACAVFGRLILRGEIEAAAPLESLLHNTYAPDVLRATFSAPETLGPLVRALEGAGPARLRAFWEHYGPLIAFKAPGTAALLAPACEQTLFAAHQAAGSAPLIIPPEVSAMLGAWLRHQKDPDAVTALARQFHSKYPDSPVYAWVYYTWVGDMPLENRRRLREIYEQGDPEIATWEMRLDLLRYRGSPPDLARMVGTWVAHDPAKSATILQNALNFIWGQGEINQAAFAGALLHDSAILNLLGNDQGERLLDNNYLVNLLEAGIETLPLTRLTPDLLKLFQRVLDPRASLLTPELRSQLQGALSLSKGMLHSGIVMSLNRQFAAMPPEAYGAGLMQFFEDYFRAAQPPDAHGLMVAAAYLPDQRVTFWEVYWAFFQHVLLEEEGGQAVCLDVLNFWFMDGARLASRLASRQQLFLADFFLGLSAALEKLQAEKGYGAVAREFEEALRASNWAGLLPPHLLESKKSRGLFRGRR